MHRPPSNSARRSRPTSAPSNTGGESDAILPALECTPGTFPAPAEKVRFTGVGLHCIRENRPCSCREHDQLDITSTHKREVSSEQSNSSSVEQNQGSLWTTFNSQYRKNIPQQVVIKPHVSATMTWFTLGNFSMYGSSRASASERLPSPVPYGRIRVQKNHCQIHCSHIHDRKGVLIGRCSPSITVM